MRGSYDALPRAPTHRHGMYTATVITAHPDAASFNHSLAQAWARGARGAGARVECFDATQLAFDPVLRGTYRERLPDEPDLARLRDSIERASFVAWFFPTWWAALPAALKGLVDRLFLPGVSFAYRGGALPEGLLAGRGTRYVATMDSPALWYWLAHHDALGGSFGRATLRFVGFSPVDRTMIYRVRSLDEAARARWITRVEKLGALDASRMRPIEPRPAGARAPTPTRAAQPG